MFVLSSNIFANNPERDWKQDLVDFNQEIEWDPYASIFAESEEIAKSNIPTPQQEWEIYGGKDCVVSTVLSSIYKHLFSQKFFPRFLWLQTVLQWLQLAKVL